MTDKINIDDLDPEKVREIFDKKGYLWHPPTDTFHDPVNHPKHYISAAGLEVIDAIDAFTYGLDGTEGYYVGNILKYVCRYYRKNGIEDLKKAKWYLTRLINYLEINIKDEVNINEESKRTNDCTNCKYGGNADFISICMTCCNNYYNKWTAEEE